MADGGSPKLPRIRGGPPSYTGVSVELATKAIESVKAILPMLYIGPIFADRGPMGDVHIDIPLMYQEFALDRIHYDPVANTFSPKGRPVHAVVTTLDLKSVQSIAEKYIKELRVVDAVEYREPERAWAVPLAWRSFIVAHVRVSHDGEEIIPDYGLTEEIRRRII